MQSSRPRRKERDLPPEDRRRVERALADLDITKWEAWNDLDVLATRTTVEEIEVLSSQISGPPENITGLFNVHVRLSYDMGDQELVNNDAFPATFRAHLEGDEVVFDEVEVDTSSFYL
jgi:hypothetical protein